MRKAGIDPLDVLRDQVGPDEEIEVLSGKVKANRLAGRIRMLFVADVITPELHKIVEFLNLEMRPAEVLTIELMHYQGESLRRWRGP